MLTNQSLDLLRDAVVLVPLNCDSMRKFPDMLKDQSCTVIPVEIPSNKSHPDQKERWKNEVRRVTQQLERKFRRKVSRQTLELAQRQADQARNSYGQLVAVCAEKEYALPGTVLLFIAHSYLWEGDSERWTARVEALTGKVGTLKKDPRKKPQIMVIGSPIYFPNYKIPFLLESLNMDMAAAINPITLSLQSRRDQEGDTNLLDRIAGRNLMADISPAFVSNDTLFDAMKQLTAEKQINGVILHILKGQIEYDFEMRRYEEYLESKDIPIFRLETDYNYQDLEQLRIRLEAFSEMAAHKMRLAAGRSA
jgi:benzoyl-CoA reductase/2-hydroxyglutaryl-CoA dehydratase subunit BcrC/BadD/HgdB